MSTIELREETKALIDMMSGMQLRAASKLLTLIKDRQTDEATLELLAIPGFAASYARGVRDIHARRTKPWRKVRRDV
jgi:hypothetical protein